MPANRASLGPLYHVFSVKQQFYEYVIVNPACSVTPNKFRGLLITYPVICPCDTPIMVGSIFSLLLCLSSEHQMLPGHPERSHACCAGCKLPMESSNHRPRAKEICPCSGLAAYSAVWLLFVSFCHPP